MTAVLFLTCCQRDLKPACVPERGVQGEGERHGRVGGIFDHILGDEAAVLNVVADADHEGEREYLALIFKVQADAGGRLLRHLKALEIQAAMQIGAVKAVADRQGVLRAAEGKGGLRRCGSRARAAVSRSETGFRPPPSTGSGCPRRRTARGWGLRRGPARSQPSSGRRREDRVFQHVIPP